MACCPKCRKSFTEGTFCPACGTRLVPAGPDVSDEAALSSAAPDIDPCPACGALISTPDWKFCPFCGNSHPKRRENRVQAQEPSADFSEAEKNFSFALKVALADGVISPKEKVFLMNRWKELGLPEGCLDIVMGCLSSFMVSDDAVTHERPALETVTGITAAALNAQPEAREEAAPRSEPEARQSPVEEPAPRKEPESREEPAPQKAPEPVEETPVRPDQPEAMSALTLALLDKSRTRESVLNAVKELLCAGVSPKMLSRHVILTLGATVKDNSDCYIAPFFDKKKLQHAPFALPAVCNEQKVLFYFDNTIFGKGDEGFLLTDDTFYSSTRKMNVLPYASMTSVRADKKKLFINGVHIHASTSEEKISAFHSMLTILSDLWTASKEMQHDALTDDQKKKIQEYSLLLNSAIDCWDTDAFICHARRILALRSDREKLCKEVILHVGQTTGNSIFLCAEPSFNMSLLAADSFVNRAVQAEEELLLYFSKAENEGFVLTNKALYSSEHTLLRLPLAAFDSVTGTREGAVIQINGHSCPMVSLPGDMFERLLYLFKLITIIQKLEPTPSQE
ncbi:zinc ribbon domain-containing protein [uncultured Mailhella sp.]|uniref:double zinc ribbon domain-containing protein n=1 Tax=uncultured Mailhella sp. TaxID=1981031 RepID=UPI0025F328A0|nr:zinc ribbon domain-containing protein [uncultured Mailhella sp.]